MSAIPQPGEVYVGKDLGGHQYEITRESIATYEAGTADRNSLYREIAPALLFHSECYTFLQDWYLPNLIGNLHAKQEFQCFDVVRPGDRVTTRAIVVERYRKRNREYVVCETLVFGPAGGLVLRGRTHQSFLAEEADGIVVDRDRERRSDRTFDVGAGTGREIALDPVPVTVEMCRAFSGPSRNYHTDREMAVALGFPDIVVQGMMSLCMISGLLTREFGEGWHRGGATSVSLVNVLWCNDVVRTRAKEREARPEGSRRRVDLDVWVEKADGTKVVVGSASALR